MKWFKHMSNASNDAFIENLEEIYGWEGYGRWFKLLEIIATKMNKSNECFAEHSWVKWQSLLKGKRNKLDSFLVHCQNEGKIKLEQNGNILKIICPKLLELRDEHTRNSGASPALPPELLPPQNQNQKTDIKIKNHDQDDSFNFNIEKYLDDKSMAAAKKAVPGKDIYYYIPIFNEFMQDKSRPHNPVGAFINWWRKYTAKEEF